MKVRSLFILTLVLGVLVISSNFRFSAAQTSTNVSGILGSDTTWTKTNSPYNLTGHILVNNGVTLTIEPGVTINCNNYYILVNGTLRARGNNANQILFNSGWQIEFTQFSTDWNELTGTGNILENVVGSLTLILKSSVRIQNCTLGGITVYKTNGVPLITNSTISGIHIEPGAKPIILNNTISGISFFMANATISGNIILYYGITVYAGYLETDPGFWPNSTTLIERNLFSGSSVGIEIYLSRGLTPGTLIIRNNTIINGTYGIWLRDIGSGPVPTILFNNIYNNTAYNLLLNIPNDVNATYNWWGTTNTSVIGQTITEFNDDFHLGRVNFSSFLMQPNPNAQPPAPSIEIPVIPEFASSITLALLVLVSLLAVMLRKHK